MHLSVMVPARDEEDVLESCLQSLLRQSAENFELGRDWELLVVDDHSTDRTREIALRLTGVVVLDPEPLQPGWTGKANALWTAAKHSRGEWLLFTDADTIHEPGSLERAREEAEQAGAAMLSYSARQLVTGAWQHILMPLIFAELTRTYPPGEIADPASPTAAANGQFLMVRRDAYFSVGGHAAVAGSLLEDVDLARLLKQHGYPIRLRYAEDAVSTRMYRTAGQMIEGWTKNLARLFPNPLALACRRGLDFLLILALPLLVWACFPNPWVRYGITTLWAGMLWKVVDRTMKSNFPLPDCILSILGLPLFCLLLVRSWFGHTIRRQVAWKGREYQLPRK